MENFLDSIEKRTVAFLVARREKRVTAQARKAPRTFWGEIKGWLDALLFAVIFMLILNQFIFQLFVIPTPSMVDTFRIGERVFVDKNVYGLEIYPGGPKLASKHRMPQRDDVITLYNPEYDSRGPVFDILAQALYMATFSLVNIDVDADRNPRERLYVKRAAGLGGDVVRFIDGNVNIRAAGTSGYVNEEDFRIANGLSRAPHRTVESAIYPALKAWGALYEYQERNIPSSRIPSRLITTYQSNASLLGNSPVDFYAFTHARNITATILDPADRQARSERTKADIGIFVPENHTLPLGDNRDNSHDGRYFGPVSNATINGRVLYRIWPLNRFTTLL
ncbi:signal peptidase I [Parasphaerochaeta coccoides]|uniref:Signal peptidase I n=1 Tax=Parasphaerochaeta coccoides (strain ATCC BAA-1237 / DSM 17374 / SPN1) TaxID=760011 RepID=F4GK36_PARC1|nr:signal peptidase I [Parasphaerochaeta coccoides]AEC01808.1 signal peptidase I [Parasphaerochaeta coccoides DSM 17374]